MDQDRDTLWVLLGETQPISVIADIVRGQRSWVDPPSEAPASSDRAES